MSMGSLDFSDCLPAQSSRQMSFILLQDIVSRLFSNTFGTISLKQFGFKGKAKCKEHHSSGKKFQSNNFLFSKKFTDLSSSPLLQNSFSRTISWFLMDVSWSLVKTPSFSYQNLLRVRITHFYL